MRNSGKCVCGAILNSESLYCTRCGVRVPKEPENYCTNQECINGRKKILFTADDTYCDMCGKPTVLGEQVLKHV